MGLAIIEHSESEQVLHLFRISVWVKALSCISKMAPLISSAPLRVHFRALKKQYEAAANEELDSISLTAVPSLPLLQALLSGVSCTLPSVPPLSQTDCFRNASCNTWAICQDLGCSMLSQRG